MRLRWIMLLLSPFLLPCQVWATSGAPSIQQLESELERNPQGYLARQMLVDKLRKEGAPSAAYWHAAWLTWLASREYSDSAEGIGFLRDRRNRDRAASSQSPAVAVTVAAANAQRLLYESCLNGSIAQQAERIRKEVADALARAEETAADAGRSDPVARMALVQLGITLDDAIVLDTAGDDRTARRSVLRKAATRGEAVAAWYPEAPGPHRSLAIIRARLAAMATRSELWDTAIAETTRAWQLDPADPYLPGLLWTLHLRAGRWTEAAIWQAKVEAAVKPVSR